MWRSVVTVFMLGIVMCASCASRLYQGTVQVQDPNGTVVKTYRIKSNAPMLLEVQDGDTSVTSDSRTQGLIESVALSFGLTKGDGVEYVY